MVTESTKKDGVIHMNGSRPRPVLIYGAIVAALEALLGVADLADMMPERVIDWMRLVLVVLVAAGGALWAQSKVTPLASPRNAEGQRLVAYVGAARSVAPGGPLGGDGARTQPIRYDPQP